MMTTKELESLMRLVADCDAFLEGRKHSEWIASIASTAANRAVTERKESLYDRLREAGLHLEEDV